MQIGKDENHNGKHQAQKNCYQTGFLYQYLLTEVKFCQAIKSSSEPERPSSLCTMACFK